MSNLLGDFPLNRLRVTYTRLTVSLSQDPRVANWSSPRPYNSKVVLEKSCGFGGSEVVLEEKIQKLEANSLFTVDKDYIK